MGLLAPWAWTWLDGPLPGSPMGLMGRDGYSMGKWMDNGRKGGDLSLSVSHGIPAAVGFDRVDRRRRGGTQGKDSDMEAQSGKRGG